MLAPVITIIGIENTLEYMLVNDLGLNKSTDLQSLILAHL